MFYTTKEIILIKAKEFLHTLAVSTLFFGIFIIIFLMGINDEFCKAVCGDVLAFGLAAFVGRTWYYFAMKRYREQQEKSHRSRRQAEPKLSTPAPIVPVTPAPIVVGKPEFFDFETHQ